MIEADSQTIVIDSPLVGRYALMGPGDRPRTFVGVDRGSQTPVSVELLPDDGIVVSTAVELRRRRLSHSNLAELQDVDIVSEVPYIAMEHLEGLTLQDYVREAGGRLSLPDFVPVAAQVLKAMGFVHANGFAWGGLSPDRILLLEHDGRENFVKLLPHWLPAGSAPRQPEDVQAIGRLFVWALAGADAVGRPYWWRDADAKVRRPLIELVDSCVQAPSADSPADANALVGRLVRCVPASMFRLRRTGETPAVGLSLPAEAARR